MRYQVRNSKNNSGDFEIENFEIKEDGANYRHLINLKMLDKWLTQAASVVIAFLSVAGVYGMVNGGDFSALSAVWTEIREPLFVAATFVARGTLYDQRE